MEQDESVETAHSIWRPVNFGAPGYQRMDERSGPPLVYNHFEYLKGIGTKSGIVSVLKSYYESVTDETNVFENHPTTYVITGSLDTQEFKDFRRRLADISKGYCKDEPLPYKHCMKNLWLVKPDNLNQGRGI